MSKCKILTLDPTPNVPEDVAPRFQEPPNLNLELPGDSFKLNCLYCDENVETETDHQIGSLSIIMCAFTMPCLVCWVPLVFNRFKDAKHSCPGCKNHLGIHVKY